MDSWSVVAMCIDIEATICLVMRVGRDGSRVMDVSDGDGVFMLFEAVLLRQGIALASSHA